MKVTALAILLCLTGCVSDSYTSQTGQTFRHTRFLTSEKAAAVSIHFPDGASATFGTLDSTVDPQASAIASGFWAAAIKGLAMGMGIPVAP